MEIFLVDHKREYAEDESYSDSTPFSSETLAWNYIYLDAAEVFRANQSYSQAAIFSKDEDSLEIAYGYTLRFAWHIHRDNINGEPSESKSNTLRFLAIYDHSSLSKQTLMTKFYCNRLHKGEKLCLGCFDAPNNAPETMSALREELAERFHLDDSDSKDKIMFIPFGNNGKTSAQ